MLDKKMDTAMVPIFVSHAYIVLAAGSLIRPNSTPPALALIPLPSLQIGLNIEGRKPRLAGNHGRKVIHHEFRDTQIFCFAKAMPGMEAIHRFQTLQQKDMQVIMGKLVADNARRAGRGYRFQVDQHHKNHPERMLKTGAHMEPVRKLCIQRLEIGAQRCNFRGIDAKFIAEVASQSRWHHSKGAEQSSAHTQETNMIGGLENTPCTIPSHRRRLQSLYEGHICIIRVSE
jgi:hypothetical protein